MLRGLTQVLSGHFHQKSEFANIRYLGSQMQFTWSDYGDNKYFHIFDTDTQEINTSFTIHSKCLRKYSMMIAKETF